MGRSIYSVDLDADGRRRHAIRFDLCMVDVWLAHVGWLVIYLGGQVICYYLVGSAAKRYYCSDCGNSCRLLSSAGSETWSYILIRSIIASV